MRTGGAGRVIDSEDATFDDDEDVVINDVDVADDDDDDANESLFASDDDDVELNFCGLLLIFFVNCIRKIIGKQTKKKIIYITGTC